MNEKNNKNYVSDYDFDMLDELHTTNFYNILTPSESDEFCIEIAQGADCDIVSGFELPV